MDSPLLRLVPLSSIRYHFGKKDERKKAKEIKKKEKHIYYFATRRSLYGETEIVVVFTMDVVSLHDFSVLPTCSASMMFALTNRALLIDYTHVYPREHTTNSRVDSR